MRLNVGCGRNPLDGWVNLNDQPGPGIDLVGDVQTVDLTGPFTEILMSHVLEHLPDPLAAMQNLYDAAAPGCRLTVICPHGASDAAWEDQTHLRPYFPSSFLAFAQTYYHLADYGYRADWQITSCLVSCYTKFRDNLEYALRHWRNVAQNMMVELEAVKPARPVTDKLTFPKLNIRWIDG